ncbi:MAG: hypothetical protein DIZ78_06325 [endosymbiont of Escarpia spicata]|uniref:Uncharacterized protein n=1 Tax=endosymbiont of Escarpia spicata TaxID=2200908 RepID=A0A370DQ79_9GAMM|nr:MAG: hypothetical protein DIZ78_06325 [endosymbiont of Escarpia spicata]
MASIYIGYADGKYYPVRAIRNGKDEWSETNLPVETAFMLSTECNAETANKLYAGDGGYELVRIMVLAECRLFYPVNQV